MAPPCLACTAPTVHYDMRERWCANLTQAAVASWVSRADGEKTKFFELVREGTQPLELTGAASARRHRSCRVHRPTDPPRLMFIGDSIMTELMEAYGMIVPNAKKQFYHFASLTAFNSSIRYGENQTIAPWLDLASNSWDALFFNPASMWRMVRPWGSSWPSRKGGGTAAHSITHGVEWYVEAARLPYQDAGNRPLFSPHRLHREFIRPWLTRLSCLASELSLPIVFVGSLPVDEQVLMLNPPKHDWDKMHTFGLLELMAQVERDAEAEQCAAHAAVSARAGGLPSSGLHFFHPSDLARACPGARCDGMHYSSNFPHTNVSHELKDKRGWNCHTSLHLWCPFLQDFLERYLPHALGGAPDQPGQPPCVRPRGDLSAARRIKAAEKCFAATPVLD